jgi:hypothetical protein
VSLGGVGRRGGVEQHQPGDLIGELGGEAEDVEATEGVPGQHVGTGDRGATKQRVQVRGDVGSVLGTVGVVTPAPAGAIVDAHPGVDFEGR